MQLLAVSTAKRPPVRNDTVRRFDADRPETDTGPLGHGDAGAASAWATAAQPDSGSDPRPRGLLPARGRGGLTAHHRGRERAARRGLDPGSGPRGPARRGLPGGSRQGRRAETVGPQGMAAHGLPRKDTRTGPGRLALETVRAAGTPSAVPAGIRARGRCAAHPACTP